MGSLPYHFIADRWLVGVMYLVSVRFRLSDAQPLVGLVRQVVVNTSARSRSGFVVSELIVLRSGPNGFPWKPDIQMKYVAYYRHI